MSGTLSVVPPAYLPVPDVPGEPLVVMPPLYAPVAEVAGERFAVMPPQALQ